MELRKNLEEERIEEQIKSKTKKNRRKHMFKARKQITEEKVEDFHWLYEKE